MKRLVCIGDSNTWGYDPRSFLGGRYPGNIRWTGILAEAGYETGNYGENGACIPKAEYAGNLFAAVAKEQPEVIIVMLGSNDILNGQSAMETARRMEAFLDALGKEISRSKILLIAPPAMKIGEWVNSASVIEEGKKLAREYRILAGKRNIAFADSAEWNAEVGYDGVHLTENGHRAFAQGVRCVLESL